jgi:hypothetical protein
MRRMEHKAYTWKMSAVNLSEEPTQDIGGRWKDNIKMYLRGTGIYVIWSPLSASNRGLYCCTEITHCYYTKPEQVGRRSVQSQPVNNRKEHWIDTKRVRGKNKYQSERRIFGSKNRIQSVIAQVCFKKRK